MLRIVTDGAADMPEDWADTYDILVLPFNILFGGQSFLQGVNLSNEDFYRLVEQNRSIPKTSQPSPQQFVSFYRKNTSPGDQVLSLHVTSKLSGTFDSALMATRELADELQIFPFDSASGSAALGWMCKEARLLDRGGASLDVILERMKFIRRNVQIVLTLDTLDYARMSGRVKALQAALASVLNVKPIVVLTDGVLDMADRVRTRRKSLEKVVEMIKARFGDREITASVVQARDPDSGRLLLEMVKATLNCREIVMTELSIAVAANLGPGTVGLVAYPINEA
jgi:DegV family protein with EDD domain